MNMGKSIKEELKELKSDIDLINTVYDECDLEELVKIKKKYNKLTTELILSKSVPDIVKIFLYDNNVSKDVLSDEYLVLADFQELQSDLNKSFLKKNKEYKKMQFSDIVNELYDYTYFDVSNIVGIALLEKTAKKCKQSKNFIKLYRDIFVATSDPIWLMKIGDLYSIENDYDEAIEAYLNYAEITEPSQVIYKKMAKIFKLQNDIQSYEFCNKQIEELSRGAKK